MAMTRREVANLRGKCISRLEVVLVTVGLEDVTTCKQISVLRVKRVNITLKTLT